MVAVKFSVIRRGTVGITYAVTAGNCTVVVGGACVLTRTGGALYTRKLGSKCKEQDLSLSEPRRLGPVSLSKRETHVLDSLESIEGQGPSCVLKFASFYPTVSKNTTTTLLLLLRRLLHCFIRIRVLHCYYSCVYYTATTTTTSHKQ